MAKKKNSKSVMEKYKTAKLITLATIIFTGIYIIVVNKIEHNQAMQTCPKPRQAGNPNLYSQYFEDYILSIVFSDTKNGTYIDVGANNPDINSVTKHFYLKGWRGINIEPIESLHKQLQKQRPGDINLNIGISNSPGELEFFQISHKSYNNGDAFSTFDKNLISKMKAEDGWAHKQYKVPVKTLNEVLKTHPLDNITFLSIDVEGMEKSVLEGLDLTKHRPVVFIIEATDQDTSEPTHHTWEPILLNNNYDFVLFDRLNRYYLAKEHSQQLKPKFEEAKKCAKCYDSILK